jgi:hypothetical protein
MKFFPIPDTAHSLQRPLISIMTAARNRMGRWLASIGTSSGMPHHRMGAWEMTASPAAHYALNRMRQHAAVDSEGKIGDDGQSITGLP